MGDLRQRRIADAIFVGAAVVAFGLYVWLGSSLTFNLDEWAIIPLADDWSLDGLMRPVNEHWALGLRVIWNSLMATVGLSSYVPYVLVNVAFNIAIGVGIYVYARRQTHPLLAAGVGVLFLFLGSGSESWFLAFQLGWTGAAAAGTWALVALLREHQAGPAWLIALLLLAGVVMFSSIGLFFVAAAAAVILISAPRRRLWWTLVPAVGVYAVWYATYSGGLVRALPDPPELLEYVLDGIANSVGQVSGLGSEIGLVIAVLLGIATVANILSRDALRLGLIAGSVGLLAEWALIGFGRSENPAGIFLTPRYVHIAAIFVLIGVVGWLAHRQLGAPPERLRVAIAGLIVLGLALAWNISAVFWFHGSWVGRAEQHRAAIAVVLDHGGSPALADDHGLRYAPGIVLKKTPRAGQVAMVPGAGELRALVSRYGSPTSDPLSLRGVAIADSDYDREFVDTFADGVRVSTARAPLDPVELLVHDTRDLVVTPDRGCVRLESEPGAHIDVAAPAGGALSLSAAGGSGRLFISSRGTFHRSGTELPVLPDRTLRIDLPDLGDDVELVLRLEPPAGPARLCLADREWARATDIDAGIDDLVIVPRSEVERPFGAPVVALSNAVTIAPDEAGCLVIRGVGPSPAVVLSAADGEAISVQLGQPAATRVLVATTPDGHTLEQSKMIALDGTPMALSMPLGANVDGWHYRIVPPPGQSMTVCASGGG